MVQHNKLVEDVNLHLKVEKHRAVPEQTFTEACCLHLFVNFNHSDSNVLITATADFLKYIMCIITAAGYGLCI